MMMMMMMMYGGFDTTSGSEAENRLFILAIISTHFLGFAVMSNSKKIKGRRGQCRPDEEALEKYSSWASDDRMSPTEKRQPILRSPSGQLLACAAACGSITHFRKGRVVFLQGSSERALFAVDEGLVKLVVSSEDGREVIVGMLGAGDFFGEDALLADGFPKGYSAVCITDSKILRVDPKQLWQKIRTSPEAAAIFIAYLLRRTQGLYEHLANCLLNDGAKRLMRTLTSQQARLGHLRMSQQTLGEMIGMTRQYVNVLLKQFSRSKLQQESMGFRRQAASDVSSSRRLSKSSTRPQ